LIRGWTRFALRKRVKTGNQEPRFVAIETEKAQVKPIGCHAGSSKTC
jgi:hypothetical protein